MNGNRVVFIKHSDCINEYRYIYQKKCGQVSDGADPYLKQIIDFFEKRREYSISVISLGNRSCKFTPQKNIELRVLNDNSRNKVLALLRFMKNSLSMFVYLARRRPAKIISLGHINYVPLLLMYSYLSRSEIYLFLAGWIKGHVFLNRLTVKMIEAKIVKVFSRNEANIDILRSLGYSRECSLYRPRYEEIPKSQIKPTALRKDKNFKVLFVGRLAPVKRIDILQEVALRTKDKGISIYIIGNGPHYESLKCFKYRNGLSNLNLLGFIPNREVYSFIRDSDIGIMPSDSEGLGKTALEFMIMETPVIASTVGGTPEIVKDGVNGFLIEPDDVDGYCLKVEQLQNDRDLLADLSRGTLQAKAEILNSDKNFSYYLGEILN